MYPWLRMIGISTLALKQSRVDLFEPTRVTLRVWPGDLDGNFHLNNGRYLSLADLGRLHWFVRTGVLARAIKQQALPVVADAIAKFRRELSLLQPFVIETRLVGWERRHVFIEHKFYVEERVVGVVAVRCVFKAGRRTVFPSELFGALSVHDTSPPLPAWLSQFGDSCDELSLQLRADESGQHSSISATERRRFN